MPDLVLTVGRGDRDAFVLCRRVAPDRLGALHALLDEAEEPADADA